MQTSFLELAQGRKLAYCLSEGTTPGIIFCGGFHSDMTGIKAVALEAFCKQRGMRFVRFDYTGHGQSSGRFEEGTIGDWTRDTLDIIDALAPGKNIIVGSSMGGWIMLLAALVRPDNIVGLVGLASAPDFTEELLWNTASDSQKKELQENGMTYAPSCYGQDPYPISRWLIEEARRHLLLDKPIPLSIPVRLIHGMEDEDVPYQTSLRLAEKLASKNVEITLIKDAGHRLSEPGQLTLLYQIIESLSAVIPA